MVNRKFDNQQAQENYLENMSLLIWQNHIIKLDKKEDCFILGVEMEGIPYFREIKVRQLGLWIKEGTYLGKIDGLIKELAAEVIKWREEKETENYKNWKKNDK